MFEARSEALAELSSDISRLSPEEALVLAFLERRLKEKTTHG
ncbi:MAG: hypothetical protein PHI71_06740 [Acidiphilium sp.]|jgi:hypothetical protein|nr:hypothetical protein [Acidiphilium sp.]